MPYKDPEKEKQVHRESCKRYYWKNREKERDYKAKIRGQVLSYYSKGEMKCAVCGEDDIIVLCIDHINNDASKHKEHGLGASFYNWLKKQGFPEGFQVLCHNCNFRKEYWRRRGD